MFEFSRKKSIENNKCKSVDKNQVQPILYRFFKPNSNHFISQWGSALMNIKKIISLWLLVVLLTHVCFVSAEINVCGNIGSGEVWSIEDSPVTVICNLNIADLRIEPGVEVLISGDYELVVSGIIHSVGSEALPVIFKPSPEVDGWKGFFFEDTIAGSEFVWTHIEGSSSSGVHIIRSSPSFDHVTFENNSGSQGGAISVDFNGSTHDLRISNSLFFNNFASSSGGAIYFVGSPSSEAAGLRVSDSVFLKNFAGTTSTRQNTKAGAVYVNGNSSFLRSSFSENDARAYTIYIKGGRYSQGGALYLAGGFSEVSASSFSGNACRLGAHGYTPDASRAYGAALYLHSGELLLSNSLLVENKLIASRHPDLRGSGLYIRDGVASIVNSTFANNKHAVYRGGGQVNILNSILFFNNNGGNQLSGLVDVSYSDIQNGFDGVGNIKSNPIFNDLFEIVPPSLAIDGGNPNPTYNDNVLPGLGGVINDMGYTGGGSNSDLWKNFPDIESVSPVYGLAPRFTFTSRLLHIQAVEVMGVGVFDVLMEQVDPFRFEFVLLRVKLRTISIADPIQYSLETETFVLPSVEVLFDSGEVKYYQAKFGLIPNSNPLRFLLNEVLQVN